MFGLLLVLALAAGTAPPAAPAPSPIVTKPPAPLPDPALEGIVVGIRAGRTGVTLRLRPWVQARVRVLMPDGSPAEGARAGLTEVDGQFAESPDGGVLTGDDGWARVRLPAGVVRVSAQKVGLSGDARLAAAAGQEPEIEIVLKERGTKPE